MTIKRYEHGGNFLKERERESKSEREGGESTNQTAAAVAVVSGMEYKEILSWEMRWDEHDARL